MCSIPTGPRAGLIFLAASFRAHQYGFVLGCCLQAVYPRGGRISAGDFLVHLATGTARVVSLHVLPLRASVGHRLAVE